MIYTITTQQEDLLGKNRCVGYTETFEESDELVRDNYGDINECEYYLYAIIEEVEPGLYTIPRKEFWYIWDRNKEKYVPCDKPKDFKNTGGWSMG